MLIDEFMPEFDVMERHTTFIEAPCPSVYAVLRSTDFGRSKFIKSLLAIRAIPSLLMRRKREPSPDARLPQTLTLDAFLENGFALLSEQKDREIVLGLVGRFWTPTGGLDETDALRFRQEMRPGLAKAAWNFALEQVDDGTKVITETRVKCTDRSSRMRFRAYWLVVRPFSGLLRRHMLRELRLESERSVYRG